MHKIAKCNKYDTFINFIKHKYKFMLYRALSPTGIPNFCVGVRDPGRDPKFMCGIKRPGELSQISMRV